MSRCGPGDESDLVPFVHPGVRAPPHSTLIHKPPFQRKAFRTHGASTLR